MTRGPIRGVRLETLSPSQYSRISQLLDEALELTPEARAAWLAALECQDPLIAADLRDLLDSGDGRAESILASAGDLANQLAALPDADRSLVGRQFGPYRVQSLIGRGGMGSVWLAERADGLFSRRVALKLVHPALMGMGLAQRLARERAILASLDHQSIARLYDAGLSEDGQPYLALEYIDGTPFTTYCDSRHLPIRARLELFHQVLSAVHYAHAHLVIHRDLKPSNILVTEEGRVCLLDFGIAKLFGEGVAKETELTQLSGRALSPEYAAPEQIAGAPITIAADVYALGVMLYELLCGQRPYRSTRQSRAALEEAILWTDPVPLSRVAVDETAAIARGTTIGRLTRALRRDLDTIAMKALRKSPKERYATVDALGEDIARWLRGEPVLARRDRLANRAVRFVRRHWVAVAVAATFVLTLVGGLVATTYESRVAAGQRDAALQAQLRSLTQTAAAQLRDGDFARALSIILEVLRHRAVSRADTSEALAVFQEARAADSQIVAFGAHTGAEVSGIEFSPDGRRVVTVSRDNAARIWDVATGHELLMVKGSTEPLWGAIFSPDGQHILTVGGDTPRIWNAATGAKELELRGHTDQVWGSRFSPDGRRVVTASLDKTARIWDATTGRELRQLRHDDRLFDAAFSPDGQRVITGSHDNTAHIWNATTGKEVLKLVGHTESVYEVAFSPDGRRALTGSGDTTARLWDAATGRLMMPLTGHNDSLNEARFSGDGRRVITASGDRTVRIWDAVNGRQLAVLVHPEQVWSAAFSPDDRYVATASSDRTARLWDLATDRQSVLVIEHPEQVAAAAFSPEGRRILTASYDRTAVIWDVLAARRLTTLRGHTDRIWGAAFSPDGHRVVTGSRDSTARVWEAATGRELLQLTGHAGGVRSAVFSPDGRRIVTASYDRTARIWDAAAGQQLVQLAGHAQEVGCAAFSPDSRRVITASADQTARIWDAANGREILRLVGHADIVQSAAFSPDGGRVVTSSDDKTARVWDARTGRELLTLSGHKAGVVDAVYSPDGRRIVTASVDRTVRVWDAAGGRVIALYQGHDDQVETAAFSPDGSRIISASLDKTARVWNAYIPTLERQFAWTEAAQFDELSSGERFALGLPAATGLREWPSAAVTCDQLAAAPYDPDRRAPGGVLDRTAAERAIAACAYDSDHSAGTQRFLYEHGRALAAAGDWVAARRDFERALLGGYRAARIDLARLLADPSAGMLTLPRAISLYEEAWHDGLMVAAFELGKLYENGVVGVKNPHGYLLPPDRARAWLWYRKGAESREPSALGRFGERSDEAAFDAPAGAGRNAHFLDAFRYFAAAAARARSEGWPDDAWSSWRYRRATLARLLARAGMMQEVADVWLSTREQDSPPPATVWNRLTASVGVH